MRRLSGIDACSSVLWFWLLCVFAITVCSPGIAHEQEFPFSSDKDEYVLGVFPYLAPRQIENIYAPITAALTEALGRHVHLTSGLSYVKFMASVREELYDIVFVQPFDYVSIADTYGYIPLATRDEPLPAILVVREDSPVKTLSDLQNKIIALPPDVAAVSRLVNHHLTNAGGFNLKTQLQYQKSHFACMHQVIIGQAHACGTAPPAVRFFQQKTDTKLRVVSKTRAIPNSLFAAHPRISQEERQKIIDIMLSWSNTEQGRKLLEKAKVKAFVTIDDREYDSVRKMSRTSMSRKPM
jgi:phosphonate transport system substrate-binding protein